MHDIIFKGLNIEKLLIVLEETYDNKQIKKYFNSRWYDRYEYRCNGVRGNKKIAFYSDFYYRRDHLLIFKNFMKQFPEFNYVFPIRHSKERLNLKRGFKLLKWDLCNLLAIRNMKMQLRKRIFFIRVIGLIQLYCSKMENYLGETTYLYGLVYNDSNPYENILVQYMKKRGIYTATLQHGIFDKHGFWKGLEFRTSVADDFLAWNVYTKELAMECSVPEERIKVLGIPRYIIPCIINRENKTGVFSVVLGAKQLFDENRKLIEFANDLAKELGKRYFIRYHPACKGNEYNMYVDKQFYIQKNCADESIYSMCVESDFSLVGSGTSMIIDLIYLKQPFFQYYMQWNGKTYRKRNNYFKNYKELKQQMQNEDDLQNEEMFYYYCTTREVKESYDKYFSLIDSKLMESETFPQK